MEGDLTLKLTSSYQQKDAVSADHHRNYFSVSTLKLSDLIQLEYTLVMSLRLHFLSRYLTTAAIYSWKPRSATPVQSCTYELLRLKLFSHSKYSLSGFDCAFLVAKSFSESHKQTDWKLTLMVISRLYSQLIFVFKIHKKLYAYKA